MEVDDTDGDTELLVSPNVLDWMPMTEQPRTCVEATIAGTLRGAVAGMLTGSVAQIYVRSGKSLPLDPMHPKNLLRPMKAYRLSFCFGTWSLVASTLHCRLASGRTSRQYSDAAIAGGFAGALCSPLVPMREFRSPRYVLSAALVMSLTSVLLEMAVPGNYHTIQKRS